MLFDWIVANSDVLVIMALVFTTWFVGVAVLHMFIDRAFRITERIELQKDMLEYLKLIAKKETEERCGKK